MIIIGTLKNVQNVSIVPRKQKNFYYLLNPSTCKRAKVLVKNLSLIYRPVFYCYFHKKINNKALKLKP